MGFVDRVDAGRRLAAALGQLRDQPVVVLGLPRGGVPVAFEVARALGAPLDVIVVRKLGVPFQPELGMGAIGEDGVRIINDEVVVLGLNRQAQARLHCENRLTVIPGATHLFEEPGTLRAAAVAASDWCTSHLTTTRGHRQTPGVRGTAR